MRRRRRAPRAALHSPESDVWSAAARCAPPWEPRGAPPSLPPGVVHVWCVALGVPPAVLARLERTLAPDEVERARRVRAPGGRARIAAARGILRTLLGAYLDVPPGALVLRCGPGGKPELAVPSGSDFRFNLAHSADRALVAVTRGAEVGVDVECVRPVPGLERLARRTLTPGEIEALHRLPGPEREREFLGYWTLKEAYAKATGAGVFRARLGEVALGAPDPHRRWRSAPDPWGGDPWSVLPLDPPAPDCVAALAVHGAERPVATFAWHMDPGS